MTHPQMATFLAAVNPALLLLPVAMTSMRALRMMWSIGRQESRLIHRYQKTTDPYTKGPARGLWQFERGGGVRGVVMMNIITTTPMIFIIINHRGSVCARSLSALAWADKTRRSQLLLCARGQKSCTWLRCK